MGQENEYNFYDPVIQAYLFANLMQVYPGKTLERVYPNIVLQFNRKTEEIFQKILISNLHLSRLILTTYHEPARAWKFRVSYLWNINNEESLDNLLNLHAKDLYYLRACRNYYYQEILSQFGRLKHFMDRLNRDFFVNFRVDLQKYIYGRKGDVRSLRTSHISQDSKGSLIIDNWPWEPIIHSPTQSNVKGNSREELSLYADLSLIEGYHAWKDFESEREKILKGSKNGHNILIETEKGSKDSFSFNIFEKYNPHIQTSINDARKKHLVKPIMDKDGKPDWKKAKDHFGDMLKYEALIPAIESFDPEKGLPAAWIKMKSRDYITRQYRSKDHTTTAWEMPCPESEEDQWRHCRFKRPVDRKDPYCERRRNGICGWPEARRRTYAQIEKTGSRGPIDSPNLQTEGGEEFDDYIEILGKAASDNLDLKIVECLKTKPGKCMFKSGNSINHSEIARQTNVSYKTVIRRIKKMKSKVKN